MFSSTQSNGRYSFDADFYPLSYWAEKWDKSETTIREWIRDGRCPGKKIGGQWMISTLLILDWSPPGEDPTGAKTDEGKGKGRRNVRDPKAGRVGEARSQDQGPEDRWAIPIGP